MSEQEDRVRQLLRQALQYLYHHEDSSVGGEGCQSAGLERLISEIEETLSIPESERYSQ